MNRLAPNEETSANWMPLIKLVVLCLVLINVFVGAIWMARNISFIPSYGDTTEYLQLSKNLIVDQYRGIFYPYFINRSDYAAEAMGIKLQHAIYLFQILVMFFSVKFLAFVLLPNTIQKRGRLLTALVIATVVSLDPLVAHFSLTILTDSLATSFTLMYLSFLILALKEASKRTFFYIAISACFFIPMSLIRVDKFYFGLIVFLSFLVILAFHKKAQKTEIIFSICCIFTAAACVSFIKSETQIYNQNRPPLDVSSLAFNRVVWPRMSNAYDYFPVKIKEIVTKAEAEKFDEHNNNVYPFLTKMLKEKDGKEIISTITLTTLEHFPLQVVAKTAFDFLKYTLPNLAFPLESLGVLPTSVATEWTISRMAMSQPKLTKYFLLLGALSFFSMLVLGSKYLIYKNKTGVLNSRKVTNPAIIVLSLAIIVNSMLFALEAGMDAHIRYALPSYTIILTGLVTLLFGYILREKLNLVNGISLADLERN